MVDESLAVFAGPGRGRLGRRRGARAGAACWGRLPSSGAASVFFVLHGVPGTARPSPRCGFVFSRVGRARSARRRRGVHPAWRCRNVVLVLLEAARADADFKKCGRRLEPLDIKDFSIV